MNNKKKNGNQSGKKNNKECSINDEDFESIIKQMNEENEALRRDCKLEINPGYYSSPSREILPYDAVDEIDEFKHEFSTLNIRDIILTNFTSNYPKLWGEINEYMTCDFSLNSDQIGFEKCLNEIIKSIGNDKNTRSYSGSSIYESFEGFFSNADHEISLLKSYNSYILITNSIIEDITQLHIKQKNNSEDQNIYLQLYHLLSKVVSEYQIQKEHFLLFSNCYLHLGFSRWIKFLKEKMKVILKSGGVLDPESYSEIYFLQGNAALIAYFSGGWKKSPDALLLNGSRLAQFFRSNTAEATKYLNCALRSKRSNAWQIPHLKSIAESFLEKARNGLTPLNGNFIELTKDSILGQRFGSCYTHGIGKDRHKLFVFGGIYTPDNNNPSFFDMFDEKVSVVYKQIATDLFKNINDPKEGYRTPLNDLHVFDFMEEKWYRIVTKGVNPIPRGYAIFKYNDNDGTLLMMGGRQKYHSQGKLLNDIWSFNLNDQKWKKIGIMPNDINHIIFGDVIHKNKWYVVYMPLSSGSVLIKCFDLKTLKWNTIIPINNNCSPQLASSQSSCWFYGNKLYLYAAEKQKNNRMMTSTIWILKFSDYDSKTVRLEWMADIIMGDITNMKCAINNEYNGVVCLMFSETSCVLDETKGQVYIFGGWHFDLDWFSVNDISKSVQIMNGRYSSVCIQIDLNKKEIRTIEALTHLEGPGMRAQSILGFYDNKLLMIGGYTTLDNNENCYEQARCFKDEWMCIIVPEELLPKNSNTNNFNNNNNDFENSRENNTIDSNFSNSKIGKHNSDSPQLIQINYNEILDNAMRFVLQDIELRKLVTNIHINCFNGCIVAKVCNIYKIFSKKEIFSENNLKLMTTEQICNKFKNFRVDEAYKDFISRDSRYYAVVLYYVDIDGTDNIDLHNFLDLTQFGFYGRYDPTKIQVFVTEESMINLADNTEKNKSSIMNGDISKLQLSENTKKAVDIDKNDVMSKFDYKVCGYSNCKNSLALISNVMLESCSTAEEREQVIRYNKGNGIEIKQSDIKLKACACKLIQYCGKECQTLDRTNHKQLCKASTLTNNKNKK